MVAPMKSKTGHFTRCMVAGIVALLPLGGAVFAIAWLEAAISSSWKERWPFYFPGLGILVAAAVVYLVGLFVTTLFGRWLWRGCERLLVRVPLLGSFYDSLKELLGYDSRRERFFRGVVAVPCEGGVELGLLTGETKGEDGAALAVVFVPSAPNPTNGRLVLMAEASLRRLDVKTADVMRALVSLGKTPMR